MVEIGTRQGQMERMSETHEGLVSAERCDYSNRGLAKCVRHSIA